MKYVYAAYVQSYDNDMFFQQFNHWDGDWDSKSKGGQEWWL